MLILLLVASCRPRAERPNVVLIVVDTLRADALGCYGNPRKPTPFVDRWADDGARFANAYAASSWTAPSVASILTSRYPRQHKVTNFRTHLAEEETTLADVLARYGYARGGFSANGLLNLQLDRSGFDTLRNYWGLVAKVPASRVIRKSLLWIDDVRRATPHQPLFLYYQFMEPHSPYQPPEPYRARFALPEPPASHLELFHMRALLRGGDALTPAERRDWFGARDIPRWFATWRPTSGLTAGDLAYARSLYDGEVAALDDDLRRLFIELDARGVLRHAIVVFTADHGEEFGEHGLFSHGMGLYDEVIRVPLVLLADGIPRGVPEEAVSGVDVAPTILDLAGLPREPTFEGRSLVPLAVRGDRSVDVVSELPETAEGGVGLHSEAVVRDGLKVLTLTRGGAVAGTEVYDLRADPRESSPPSAALSARAVPLMASLRAFSETLASRARASAPVIPVKEQTRDRLRALGYVE